VNVLWYVLIHSYYIHSCPIGTRASLHEEAAHLRGIKVLRTYRDIKEWDTCEGSREMGVFKENRDRSFQRTRTPNSEQSEKD